MLPLAITQQKIIVPVLHLFLSSIDFWLGLKNSNSNLSLFVQGSHLLLVAIILTGINISTHTTNRRSNTRNTSRNNLVTQLLHAENHELRQTANTFGGARQASFIISLVWLSVSLVLGYLGLQQLFLDDSKNYRLKFYLEEDLSTLQFVILVPLGGLLLEIGCLISIDLPGDRDLGDDDHHLEGNDEIMRNAVLDGIRDQDEVDNKVKIFGSARNWLLWLFGCCALGSWASLLSVASKMVLPVGWMVRVDAIFAIVGTVLMAIGAILIAERALKLGLKRALRNSELAGNCDGSDLSSEMQSIEVKERVEQKQKRATSNIYAL
ncbi:hypothetical protein QAD02_000852 [Eretmocerus hayati]|uniref:Uncharacterized protein n=1 Tax=Eretmocerus hayati TaxID=131215 RepID=A0ACC2NEK7_9HYME|nr:hypothetical protein QAD02_000852 [Eretmocerus hayati]